MPRLSKVQRHGETKPVTIDIDGETLNLTIQPDRITIGVTRRLQRAAEANDLATVADVFFGVVSEWDLTDDKGKVLPLDATTIDLLTLDTFATLMSNIQAAAVPNPVTSNS